LDKNTKNEKPFGPLLEKGEGFEKKFIDALCF